MKLINHKTCVFAWSILMFCLSSCLLYQEESVKNMVKDFNLAWREDPKNQSIYINQDHSEYGGLKVVDKTVVGIGWNQDFIVALQSPDLPETDDPVGADTVFHIIDIRDYSRRFWGPKEHHLTFENETEFRQKISELGIPDIEISSTLQP